MNTLPALENVLGDLKSAINKKQNCSVFGLSLGEKAFFLCGQKRQIALVTNSIADANKYVKIFESFGKTCKIMFSLPDENFAFTSSINQNRVGVVDALNAFCKNEVDVVILSPAVLMQKFLPKIQFEKFIISLKVGKIVNQKALIQNLITVGYQRVEAVSAPGEFSVKGDILDIFNFTDSNPTRIDFFDDEIETISQFNVDTYKKIKPLKNVDILPISIVLSNDTKSQIFEKIEKDFNNTLKSLEPNEAIKLKTKFEEFKVNFFGGDCNYINNWLVPFIDFNSICEYFNSDALIVFDDVKQIYDAIKKEYCAFDELYNSLSKSGEILFAQKNFYIPEKNVFDFKNQLLSFQQITSSNRIFNPSFVASYKTISNTNYFGNFDLLVEDLKYYKQFDYTVIIYCGTKATLSQIEKLVILKDIDCNIVENTAIKTGFVNLVLGTVPYGAIFVEDKIAVIGFEELQRKKPEKKVQVQAKKEEFTLPKIGDYVVHENYGIGKCIGIEKLKFTDYQKDYIILQYDAGDKLYLPTEQIGLISTYISDGKQPKLNKLGSKDFEETKAKVKANLKELAFSLVELYAKREKLSGFKFEIDKKLYREFENSFPYDETDDQITATSDVLQDMTSGKIMDIILCGDVGYGKTEVALRAAFVAALNNKQTAFLAPTTVLSEQHFGTAKSRLQNFGIVVECLNRFKTKAQQKEILNKLKNGEIDVICGTHRLLSKDVVFKDLGLLILDEEQRFGVADKEKIKTLKNNVDVLTLSATPIPRTLHMGLVGIRDISVLATPPKSRLPVQTSVGEYSTTLLKSAISRELSRGGQTLIIYNRVESIAEFAHTVKSMLPDNVVVRFAHGQMESNVLEKEIYDLYSGKTDVLVSTTLIENGIDLPNANTLIIIDADKLGLSQLYQLKGRVGRSKNLGYAYFTFKPDKMLSSDAYKRLNAIMEFTELGSGFKIAMKDLEIRGCGNILGAEQSGHMAKVGYDMYCKILNEAIGEIKGKKEKKYLDIKLDIAVNSYIPESYIQSSDERFRIYSNLKQVNSTQILQKTLNDIKSIYGDVPQEILNLSRVALLRNLAREFDVKRICIDRERCFVEFYDRETMLNKNLANTIKELGYKNSFASTGIVMNFALSEYSVKRKLEILCEIFEHAQLKDKTK